MSKGKFIAIGAGAAVMVVGIAIALAMSGTPSNPASKNPRVVFWPHVHGLGVDPSDSSVLYIATHGDFYQSINGGPPVKVDKIRADYMAFNAPMAPGAPLYSSGHPSTGGNTGLIKSTDGGRTWEVVSQVLDPPVDFHAMAVSMSDPNIIMGFDSGGRGLFKTTDAGKNWEKMDYPGSYVTSLAISTKDPQTIFAGTDKGLFQSADGGITWSELNQYKGLTIFALAFDVDGNLYASIDTFGLAKSTDLGKTWEKINRPDLTVTSVAVDSKNNILYASGHTPKGYQEVYRSSSNGNSWDLVGTNKEM
jgi:photosystem II stability/assembly factor-like uncharacterized protein